MKLELKLAMGGQLLTSAEKLAAASCRWLQRTQVGPDSRTFSGG